MTLPSNRTEQSFLNTLCTLLVTPVAAVCLVVCIAGAPAMAQDEPGNEPPAQPEPPVDPDDLEDEPAAEEEAGDGDEPGHEEGEGHDDADAPVSPDVQAQDLQAKVNAAMLAAQRFEAEGRWRKAADKYAEALQLMPDNAQAAAGYRKAAGLLDERPMLRSGGSSVGAVQMELQEQRERTIIEFNDAVLRVQQLLEQERWDEAQQSMLTAKIKLDQRKSYLSQADYEEMESQADTLISTIDQGRINARLLDQQAQSEEARQSSEDSRARERREKDRIITENLRRVRELQLQRKYTEALQVLDRILFLDSNNPTAQMLRDLIEQTQGLVEYSNNVQAVQQGLQDISVEMQQSLVIPRSNINGPGPRGITEDYLYPEDWEALSARRKGLGGYQESERDRRIRRELSSNQVEIEFSAEMTFQRGLDFLQEVSGVQVYPDWTTLNAMGVDETTTFEGGLQLSKLPLDIVL
ncbi:MAG: hypothetical protein MK101_12330, partial [Phycisphaerales bacterium]|nr:hypothetical protein [Phycisphaerales bacterium]